MSINPLVVVAHQCFRLRIDIIVQYTLIIAILISTLTIHYLDQSDNYNLTLQLVIFHEYIILFFIWSVSKASRELKCIVFCILKMYVYCLLYSHTWFYSHISCTAFITTELCMNSLFYAIRTHSTVTVKSDIMW